ncbi:MAG: ADP-ribosylglycohydrolase [Candidatus Bathyarchaeota archaeon BA2]|nr:MAG: ADP-ribosylglycohydrolase [Candidatus Bathyarchaeota archaeon BA2]
MLRSKFIGCLVGSAVGDALGRSSEGLWFSEAKIERFSGRWTDDTHMMIGVAESLIATEGFDGSHMAQTFIKNYEREPWRGYASGPPRVFRWIKSGMAWNEASKRLFGGSGSYGNGAAMRVAPVGLFYHDDLEQLRAVVYGQSQITHSHELGKEGALLQAYAVALATNANPPFELDSSAFLKKLKGFTRNEVYKQKLERAWELLGETNRLRVVRELGNGVEAHNSVPTAIYSFLRNPNSFEACVLYAISLGGDTDTIGAMTGAISGAYHGVEAIPERWKSKLEGREYIEKLAGKLWGIKSRL